jgi:hypothetical protein
MATPILDDAEVARRKLLLAELQAALAGPGVRCILAGRQRLVLRYSEPPPHAPSGPADPGVARRQTAAERRHYGRCLLPAEGRPGVPRH